MRREVGGSSVSGLTTLTAQPPVHLRDKERAATETKVPKLQKDHDDKKAEMRRVVDGCSVFGLTTVTTQPLVPLTDKERAATDANVT